MQVHKALVPGKSDLQVALAHCAATRQVDPEELLRAQAFSNEYMNEGTPHSVGSIILSANRIGTSYRQLAATSA